jgi:hypothetical protein
MAPIGSRPEPIGSLPWLILWTTCTMCVLFILWRRASSFRRVVSHQLKTLREPEGRVRLSEDNGPPATEFLNDDYDDDIEVLPSPDIPQAGAKLNHQLAQITRQ